MAKMEVVRVIITYWNIVYGNRVHFRVSRLMFLLFSITLAKDAFVCINYFSLLPSLN